MPKTKAKAPKSVPEARKSLSSKKSAAKVINEVPENVSVLEIQSHPDNPRKGDLSFVRKSIREHGFYGAIVVQASTKHILVGNQRWEAAKKEGIKEVPVVWVDVDDDMAKRILLVDNKSADRATWDHHQLAAMFKVWEDQGEDYSSLGWEDHEIESLLKAEWSSDNGESVAEDNGEATEKESEPLNLDTPQKRPGADPNKASIVMTKDQYQLLAEVRRGMTKGEDELEDAEVIEALCYFWLQKKGMVKKG